MLPHCRVRLRRDQVGDLRIASAFDNTRNQIESSRAYAQTQPVTRSECRRVVTRTSG